MGMGISFTFAFVSCNVKTKATAGSTDSLSSLLFPYLGHRLALFLPDDRDDGDSGGHDDHDIQQQIRDDSSKPEYAQPPYFRNDRARHHESCCHIPLKNVKRDEYE